MDRQERQIGVRLSYADKYAYEMLVDTNRIDHDSEYCVFSSPLEFMREAIKDQFEKHFTEWSKRPDSPFNVYDKLPVEKFPAEVPVTCQSLPPKDLEHWHRCRWSTWEDLLANSTNRHLTRGFTTNLSFDDVMDLVRGGFLAPQMLSEFTGGESVHYYHNKENGDLIEQWKTACGDFERVNPQPEPRMGWDPYSIYWRAGKSKPNKPSPSLDLSKATTVVEHDISADLHFKMIELDGVKYSVHTHLKNGKPSGEPVVKRIDGDSDTKASAGNLVSPDAAAGADANQDEYAKQLQKWEDAIRKHHKELLGIFEGWFGSPAQFNNLLAKALKCTDVIQVYRTYAAELPGGAASLYESRDDNIKLLLDPAKNKRLANFLRIGKDDCSEQPKGKSLRAYHRIINMINHQANIETKYYRWWDEPLTDDQLIEFCQDPINSVDACFLAIAARTELRANFLKETYLKFDSVRPVLEQIRNGSIAQEATEAAKKPFVYKRSAREVAYQNLRILKQGKSIPGTRPRQWSHLIYFLNPQLGGYIMSEDAVASANYLANTRVAWLNTAGFLGDENSEHHYEAYCDYVEALAKTAKVKPALLQRMLSGECSNEWRNLMLSKEVAEVMKKAEARNYMMPILYARHPSKA